MSIYFLILLLQIYSHYFFIGLMFLHITIRHAPALRCNKLVKTPCPQFWWSANKPHDASARYMYGNSSGQHPFQPLRPPVALFSKVWQVIPATSIQPSLKALLGPFLLSRSHAFGSCWADSFSALSSPWACTHTAVVLAPAVRQCLGLARMPRASCVCFALLPLSHPLTPS